MAVVVASLKKCYGGRNPTEVQKLWQRVTAIEKNAADADKRIADLEMSAAAATEVQKLWQRVTAIEKNAADADKRIADLEMSAAAAAGQKDPEAHKKRAEFLDEKPS